MIENFYKNSYHLIKEEDINSIDTFFTLDFTNKEQLGSFFALEKKKKYVKEVGPRGGVKYLTIKDSNDINPFLEQDEPEFYSVNEYSQYVSKKKEEKMAVDKEVAKIESKKSIFLMLALFSFMFLIVLGISIFKKVSFEADSTNGSVNIIWNIMIIVSVIMVILGIVFLFVSKEYHNSAHNLLQVYYSNIKVLSQYAYNKIIYNVKRKQEFDNKDLKEIIKNSTKIEYSLIANGYYTNENQGIYMIVVGEIDYDQYHLPIYVGLAENLIRRWKQHINQINQIQNNFWEKSEMKYKKIVEYLNHKRLTLDDISFYILEENDKNSWNKQELKKNETKWIEFSQSGSRGFNAIN
ncbi:hypothetical protein SCHIN_v1c07490 [Spiroplasma chinense]|uniref:GIY-YIG domain-containing protein n=1 Tax=Spiroplasma chinense TaxID=216932 RepID=A0A5B9Y4D8_9MOLU|nr:GIY-YIG nuclease family protein [Spiroplasma chinense]QEH61944.1 hypothetical protein SCHIN_v1c07490 [Spiroplasma chinense]